MINSLDGPHHQQAVEAGFLMERQTIYLVRQAFRNPRVFIHFLHSDALSDINSQTALQKIIASLWYFWPGWNVVVAFWCPCHDLKETSTSSSLTTRISDMKCGKLAISWNIQGPPDLLLSVNWHSPKAVTISILYKFKHHRLLVFKYELSCL